MADVEFYEPDAQLKIDRRVTFKSTPAMAKWLMKTGLVEDERAAKNVLLLAAIVFFILSFIIFTVGVSIRPKSYFIPKERLIDQSQFVNQNASAPAAEE
jgi:hypothetical protein